MACLIWSIFFTAFFPRYLATGDSFPTFGFSYCVGASTVRGTVLDASSAIWTALVEEVMPVPTREGWRTMAEQFAWRWNFPNAIGAIDGMQLVIHAPSGSFSLAVVDDDCFFRVVDVGGYGRTSGTPRLEKVSGTAPLTSLLTVPLWGTSVSR